MNDLWKTPPPPPSEDDEEREEPRQPEQEQEPDPDRYEARHRAAGRPPLIRRKARRLRDQRDLEEPARERPSIDELLASRPEEEPRWTGEESSAVWPQAPEVAEERRPPARSEPLPSRAELRRTRRDPDEAAPHSPDYVGRHLAPKKRTLFARPAGTETDEEHSFVAREEIAVEPVVETDPSPETEGPDEQLEAASIASAPPEAVPAQEGEAPEIMEPHEPTVAGEEVVSTPSEETEEPVPAASIVDVTEPEIPEPAPAQEPVAEEDRVEHDAPPTPPLPPQLVVAEDIAEAVSYEATLSFDEPAGEVEPDAVDDSGSEDDDEFLGPRRQKLMKRKRRTRVLQVIGSVLLSGALVVGAVIVGGKVIDDANDEKKAETTGAPPLVREPVSTLIFGTKGEGTSKEALWMTLLTYDPEDKQGAVVYIPSHTAVEVPGRGLQGVGESYTTGGVPLLLVSAENLLGVPIDRYIELDDSAARELFDASGALSVNVPNELRVSVGDDEARLILVEGEQQLDPSLLVKMLYLRGIDGDDVELGSRHLAFWDALLDHLASPGDVEALVEEAASAFEESDADAEEHQQLLAALAALPTADLTITTLPVRPISAGESELYAVNEAEVRAFMTDTIGFAAPVREDARVQVLNGNGVPGIGQDVARKLVGEGFRVILSGNARRLTYRRTLIITYDNTPEGQRLAERAKRLLGVGEVQVSVQQQGIVDLTIVVGKDFLRAD